MLLAKYFFGKYIKFRMIIAIHFQRLFEYFRKIFIVMMKIFYVFEKFRQTNLVDYGTSTTIVKVIFISLPIVFPNINSLNSQHGSFSITKLMLHLITFINIF